VSACLMLFGKYRPPTAPRRRGEGRDHVVAIGAFGRRIDVYVPEEWRSMCAGSPCSATNALAGNDPLPPARNHRSCASSRFRCFAGIDIWRVPIPVAEDLERGGPGHFRAARTRSSILTPTLIAACPFRRLGSREPAGAICRERAGAEAGRPTPAWPRSCHICPRRSRSRSGTSATTGCYESEARVRS